jgi:signal transduction histidine kinase
MFGLPQEYVHGREHDQVLQFKRIDRGMTLAQAESGGWPLTPQTSLYLEGDLERPGGMPLPVSVTYSPLLSADGHLLNIIAVVRDITRFREADELKATFISVISHELKTPVALIKGYTSTLRRDDANWERAMVQDSLAIIEEEADRLTTMIDNLLDASRLEAGGLPLNFTDVQLAVVAERLAERFLTQSGSHKIEVTFQEEFPVVVADEDRIAQVISNLISNGIKYSPEGGTIRVSGEARRDQVVICIEDEGPGIAPGDMPFIFDRFYRADNAVKTTKGAGLGLYLARAVVEAHGGRIWVDAKPGAGARICFSLPRSEG